MNPFIKSLFTILSLISLSGLLAQATFPINSSSNIVSVDDEPISFKEFVRLTNLYDYKLTPYFTEDGALSTLELDLYENNHLVNKKVGEATTTSSSSADYGGLHETFESFEYYTTVKELKGKSAPLFEVSDLNGNKIRLDDLLGKVVVLNFWFSRCSPCLEEMPELNDLQKKYGRKDVAFLAMSIEDANRTIDFLAKNTFNFQIIPEAHPIAGQYKVPGYPTTVIIDKNGIVSEVYSGILTDVFGVFDKAIYKETIKNEGDLIVELLPKHESITFANATVYNEQGAVVNENEFYDAIMNYKCDIYKHTDTNLFIYYTLTKTVKK